MEAGGAARVSVQITGERRCGGLHQGSGDRGRDMDRTAGCVGAVFTGLGVRRGRDRARTMASIASSPGDQGDDTGGGAEPRRTAQGLPLPGAQPLHHHLICPTARSPWVLLGRSSALEGPVTGLANQSCLCLTWILPDTWASLFPAQAPLSSPVK